MKGKPLLSARNREENLKVEFSLVCLSDTFLSSKASVAYVEVRVFAHATEDLEKVLTAARNTLPVESAGTVVFKKTDLTGHHGNPITLFEAKLKNKKAAEAFLEKLSSRLEIMDKEVLSNEIERHLEKGNLYIRLNKQSAYLGKVKLGSTDSIHLRMHFKKPSSEDIIAECKRVGLLP